MTPAVRAHWHALLRTVGERAGIELDCIDHAAPAPLDELWQRDDLALAFMCGFPLATLYPQVRPLAAPVPVDIQGDPPLDGPTYRSVWLVHADSAYETLASTFGGRIGWTVEHSHSGFNAPRHALLRYRTANSPRLYSASIGPLGHPRAALTALAENRIDVVAIDAYWWRLLQRHDPSVAAGTRVIHTTPDAPMPPLVASPSLPEDTAQKLIDALRALSDEPGTQPQLDALGVRRFVPVDRDDYAALTRLDREARDAGYPQPA